MPDYFSIDGERSDLIGIYLQGPITFGAAEPKLKTVSVPGRNGDLHFFDGSFSNVPGTAKCFALKEESVNEVLNATARWCLLDPGYHRLETMEEPDYYRLARVCAGPETEIRMKRLAPFSLKFDCKPQKFFLDGDDVINISASGATIQNPGFPSLPLIDVYGSGAGTLSVGGYDISFNDSFSGPITIDCDTQNAYQKIGSNAPENKNSVIYAPKFPVLSPGSNTISWMGGITSVKITPRWWTL